MRIVHIMTRLLRAGSEENVLLTCRGQIDEGHEVFLVHGGRPNPDLAIELAPDLPLIEVSDLVRPVRPFQDFAAYRDLKSILRRLQPDVVHTHQSKAGVVGRYAARAADVPCVVHGVHILPFVGSSGASRLLYLHAERAAARITDGFVHVSEGMLSACLENGIGAGVMHEVIQSGFDLERFRSSKWPDDWKQLLGVADGASKPVVILMMAALEPRKRHLQFLDLLPKIIEAHPDTRIVFAGEGPLHQDIRAKADALCIGHAVKLAGYRRDPQRLIALSDISILSSGQEGLPRCILQSIVGGRPTVAFDLPGLDAVVKTGKNGCVVPMDDWVSFGQALEKLVADEQLRGSMAAAAAMTDLSHWDWRHMGTRTNAFYERLLDAKGGRSRALA